MPLRNPRHPNDDTRSLLSPLRPGDDDAAFDAVPSAFDPPARRLRGRAVFALAIIAAVLAYAYRDAFKPISDPVNHTVGALMHHAGVPDISRPIDQSAARDLAMKLPGVRSAFWIDGSNLMLMVDGQRRRSMATIDQVCDALKPLGDTLGVVVNVQDITAQHADVATTLSRNCVLPEGERAMLQGKRDVDVVDPELRKAIRKEPAP